MIVLNKWLIAIASAVAVFFGTYLIGRKSGSNAEKLKSTTKARETESKAVEALTKGLAREEEAVAAARARRVKRLRDRKQS